MFFFFFLSFRISLKIRMVGSLSCIFLLFVLTTVLVKVDTDSCKYMIVHAISYVLFSVEKNKWKLSFKRNILV